MNILIVAQHWPGHPACLLAKGFEQVGHHVYTCGPYLWGNWHPNAEYVIPSNLDLIISADHKVYWKIPSHIPHILVAQDVVSFNGEMYSYRDKAHFDHEFYVDSRDCEGRPNAHFLPCAYDPELHTPGSAYEERPIPIAMYGQLEGGRQELIDYLTPDIQVATGYVGFMQYVFAYQNTQISLCHSRCGNLDQRLFETMAMGCAVISDRKLDAERVGLIPGKHYLVYDSPEQAKAMIHKVIDDLALAHALVMAGMEWVAPHTWAARAREIIHIVFGGNNDKTIGA